MQKCCLQSVNIPWNALSKLWVLQWSRAKCLDLILHLSMISCVFFDNLHIIITPVIFKWEVNHTFSSEMAKISADSSKTFAVCINIHNTTNYMYSDRAHSLNARHAACHQLSGTPFQSPSPPGKLFFKQVEWWSVLCDQWTATAPRESKIRAHMFEMEIEVRKCK